MVVKRSSAPASSGLRNPRSRPTRWRLDHWGAALAGEAMHGGVSGEAARSERDLCCADTVALDVLCALRVRRCGVCTYMVERTCLTCEWSEGSYTPPHEHDSYPDNSDIQVLDRL